MHDFNLWHTLLTIIVVMGAIQGTTAFLILVERKVAAWVQDRHGPNRVGPGGLLQPLADGLKFIFKEEVIPGHVDKVLFLLAPAIAMGVATLAFAVVPFGPTTAPPTPPKLEAYRHSQRDIKAAMETPAEDRSAAQKQILEQTEAIRVRNEATLKTYNEAVEAYRGTYQFVIAPDVNIGILFVLAVGSLAVYGVILGGWSANNKYAFIGSLRSSAQIISYEIPLGLSILGVILMTGSLNLEQIIWQQASPGNGSAPMWNVFYQPLAFVIFLVSAFAETNRLPFDLPECEQELVGGFHTEYSAFKFGMFFLGEYTHMITTSFLMAVLFFGGWHFPFIATAESFWLIKLAVFAGKMAIMILFFMLVRWTIPRFRFDQLMGLAWKVLIPLALINLVMVMVVKEYELNLWWLLPGSLVVLLGSALFASSPTTPPSVRRQIREEVALTR